MFVSGFLSPFLARQNDWRPHEGSKESETSNRWALWDPAQARVPLKAQGELKQKAGGGRGGVGSPQEEQRPFLLLRSTQRAMTPPPISDGVSNSWLASLWGLF